MSIGEMLATVRSQGRDLLMEDEAKAILSAAGIPVTPCRVVFSAAEAARAARETGFPVALKVRSPAITHKTDVGGVYLNLGSSAGVRHAFWELANKVRHLDPRAGAVVQPMAPPGVEVMVGMTRDSQFGPVLAFGLGGTLVEVLDDICFRMVPVTGGDAREMIGSVRGSALLKGYRGSPGVNMEMLAGILVKVSRLAEKYPVIKEIDINPVSARPDGVEAVDARIVIRSLPRKITGWRTINREPGV